jgi:hypothetical protein
LRVATDIAGDRERQQGIAAAAMRFAAAHGGAAHKTAAAVLALAANRHL